MERELLTPRGVHIRIPRTREYGSLHGKRDFAGGIVKDLETEMILDHPRRMSCIVMRKQRALRHRQQGRGFCVKREAETTVMWSQAKDTEAQKLEEAGKDSTLEPLEVAGPWQTPCFWTGPTDSMLLLLELRGSVCVGLSPRVCSMTTPGNEYRKPWGQS